MKKEMKWFHIICLALVILVASAPHNIYPEPITVMAQTSCVPPPSGLVSWWPGDGDANDIVGDSHGTLQGNATFATGMVGQAFSFDGNGDFVSLPANPAWNFGTGPFTIDFWERSSGPTTTRMHALDLGSYSTKNLEFDFNDFYGLWVYWNSTGGTRIIVGSAGAYTDGQWHHIALTRNGTTMTLYVDGSPVGSATYTPAIDVSNTGFNYIGAHDLGYTGLWNGEIDEVEIFNRALSASEIQAIYNAGSAGKCKDCSPDQTPPVGNCPADTTRLANANCQAAIPTVLANVTATDNCTPSASLTMTQTPSAGTLVGLGVHPIMVTVSDGVGNSSACTTNVNVADQTPPVITCPPNQTAVAGLNLQAAVNVGTATATDNCQSPVSVMGTRSDGPSKPLTDPYPVGATTIVWKAADGSNITTCPQTITVLSPQGATQRISDNVTALVNQGVLNQGQGNALLVKLQAAIESLNKGTTNAACGQLQAFISQVETSIGGPLTPAQGQQLIDAATTVRNALGC